MSTIQPGSIGMYTGCLSAILSAALVVPAPVMANNTKPTEVPAKVLAHLALQEAPGSEMLLLAKENKEYLYVQKASKQGFTVIDVSKPAKPNLVTKSGSSGDAAAGKLELAGPDVGLAEVPDRNSKGVLHSADNPTETVKVLDLTDPAHPKVLQTFTGVTSTLQDPARGLIYLANNEGLWILSHAKPGLTPAKKKRSCGSEDAIASMPPDCQ